MFKKILVPLDGSALAAAALLPASALARRDDAELMLVGVPSTLPVEEMDAYLATMVSCLSADGLLVRATLPPRSPEDGVNEATEFAHADVICMSTHGCTGLDALLSPDVTWQVLAQTSAPILVCNYAAEEQAGPSVHQLRFMDDATVPILVPLDGSLHAEGVLPFAWELAREFGNPLVLLHTGNSLFPTEGASALGMASEESVGYRMEEADAYLSKKQQELTRAGLRARTVVRNGAPAAVIQAIAQEYHAGLIVIASHGQGWLGRLVLGSVARSVLSQSETPVLLVRRFAPVPSAEKVEAERTLAETRPGR